MKTCSRLAGSTVHCPFSYGTFAGTHSDGRDAPVPVVRIYEEKFLEFSYVFCSGRSQQGGAHALIRGIISRR